MNTSYKYQRNEIERQAKEAGINLYFSGYSEAHGLSIYYRDENNVKYRFASHSVTNINRIFDEKHFNLPFEKQLGMGGKITEKTNILFKR